MKIRVLTKERRSRQVWNLRTKEIEYRCGVWQQLFNLWLDSFPDSVKLFRSKASKYVDRDCFAPLCFWWPQTSFTKYAVDHACMSSHFVTARACVRRRAVYWDGKIESFCLSRKIGALMLVGWSFLSLTWRPRPPPPGRSKRGVTTVVPSLSR